MKKGGVFLVGLHLAQLTLVLRPLGLEVLDLEFEPLSILRQTVERALGGIEGRAIGHDLSFDRRLLLRQGGKLAVETSQLHIGTVEIHKGLKIRMHRRTPILPFAG